MRVHLASLRTISIEHPVLTFITGKDTVAATYWGMGNGIEDHGAIYDRVSRGKGWKGIQSDIVRKYMGYYYPEYDILDDKSYSGFIKGLERKLKRERPGREAFHRSIAESIYNRHPELSVDGEVRGHRLYLANGIELSVFGFYATEILIYREWRRQGAIIIQ